MHSRNLHSYPISILAMIRGIYIRRCIRVLASIRVILIRPSFACFQNESIGKPPEEE